MALDLVRQYLIHEGDFSDPDLVREFKTLFSRREQVDIMAAVKMMSFFNMLVNTIVREQYTEGAACAIKPASPDNGNHGK